MKFIVVCLIIDFCFGFMAKQIFTSQKSGKFHRSNYVIHKANEEVMIFGSSHAIRHYIPDIIKDSLDKTCYNAGAEGQQLLFHRALQKMMFKRHSPDIIILNIDESFLYKSTIAHERLSDLHPYYSNFKAELNPILSLKSNFTNFRLFFKAYQTNSTLIHILKYYLKPQVDYNGYRPLHGIISLNTLNSEGSIQKEYIEEIDHDFVTALKDFISDCRKSNVQLIFITSPNLIMRDLSTNKSLSQIKTIANAEGVPFLDFLNSKQFVDKYQLFNDSSHLNDKGARIFTSKLSELIKSLNGNLSRKE